MRQGPAMPMPLRFRLGLRPQKGRRRPRTYSSGRTPQTRIKRRLRRRFHRHRRRRFQPRFQRQSSP
jgi:hypothetical protein